MKIKIKMAERWDGKKEVPIYLYAKKRGCEWIKISKNEFYKKQSPQLIQYTLDWKVVKRWKSVYRAAKDLGGSPANIYNHIKNKTKSAYGFKWRYDKMVQKNIFKM